MLKILWRKCSHIVLKIYESFLPQRFPPEYSYGTWSYHLMWHVDEIVHVKQLHKGESYSCSLALKIRPLGFSTGLASPACVQDKQHGACTCIHVYTACVDLFVAVSRHMSASSMSQHAALKSCMGWTWVRGYLYHACIYTDLYKIQCHATNFLNCYSDIAISLVLKPIPASSM